MGVTTESGLPGLEVRQAEPDDAERLAALMFRAPGREAVAMAGSAEAAERFQAIVFRRALEGGSGVTIVVESEGRLAGFAEVVPDTGGPSLRTVARAAIDAMGVVGAVRAARRWSARRQVHLDLPPGGVHLEELHVTPDLRNRGVGAFLLDRVEARSVADGARLISLTTAIDNPARRLYERHGFRLAGERTDARYERITGSAGRVLLVKDLPADG